MIVTLFFKLLDKALSRTVLVLFAALLLAGVMGIMLPTYVALMGSGGVSKLAALPAVMILGLFLIYDKRMLLITILLFRSIGDPILESTKISLGGMQLGVGLFVNLLVIFITILFVLERPKEFPKQLAAAWVPFLVIGVVSFAISPNKSEGIRVLLALVSYMALFISSTYLIRTREDFNFAIKLVICSSILTTLYSFVDIALHMRGSGFRLNSTFGHPNIFGFYLTLIISLLLYVLKSPNFTLKQWPRLAITGYMLLQIVLLLLTQARSAWIGCAAIFVLYAIFFERKYLLYLVVTPVIAMLVPSVRDRVMDIVGGGNEVYMYARLNSFTWRVLLWEAGLQWMEPARYLFGYGLEAFRFHSQTFFSRAGGIDWSPHNLLVQWIFDIGLVGLGAYLYVFWRVIGRIRGLLPTDRLGAIILIATVIAHLIVSCSDNLFAYLVFNWYFWFIIGGACSIAPALARSRKAPLPPQPPQPPYPAYAVR